jgi:ATP-dependent Clp protease ATP-binding subunit ClpC
VDFKNTIVIMTSNIGAGAIAKNTTLGFSVGEDETGVSYEDMKNRIMGELKKVFRPELLNRIDEVIVFHKLSKDEIKSIVDQLMKRLREQMKVHEVAIELTDSAKEFMVEKGYDPTMGARPLRRAIQRWIEDPLADFVLARNLQPGSTVLVDHVEGDEEVSLQMIDPVDVPDAPPADLVPAEGPAGDHEGDEDTGEHDSPAE